MCLYPLLIRNPTKVIDRRGGQLLRMQVPCGKCAECLQAKRNEWYIRTHYEMLNTFAKGGYVYFDTLTYSDEHLPLLSHFVDIDKYDLRDFSCFNHEHIRLFLKRLRRMIAYHYGIKKDAFRYFMTSEYGEDERYTHRPHYHPLFFVYADIPPLNFSQMVADCWQYGRTDGFPFKPATYVYNHVYGRDCGFGSNTDFKTTTAVAMYVSKYITKNSKFSEKLKKRLAHLEYKLTVKHRIGTSSVPESDLDFLNKLKRNIDMFHRQSQGFGLSYLENLSPTKLMFLDEDKVYMQDSKNVVKTYPLPMYYKRKLYYELCKRADGTCYWQPTDKGSAHIIDMKLKSVDRTSLKYMDIVRNCSNDSLVQKFFALLGDRTITDYVIYEQFYKNRHRDFNSLDLLTRTPKQLTDEENNLYDWCVYLRHSLCPNRDTSFALSVDEASLRVPVQETDEHAKSCELDILKSGHPLEMFANSRKELLDDYIGRYTFNENTDPSFANFDKLTVLLSIMNEEKRDDVQMTFDYLEDLKARYKNIFNFNL